MSWLKAISIYHPTQLLRGKIGRQLSWGAWFRVSHEFVVKQRAKAADTRRLELGQKDPLTVSSLTSHLGGGFSSSATCPSAQGCSAHGLFQNNP